ncbi:spore germination protein GerPE [Aquibacillus saliphilus]|uniref:spore germination protein GerPE n=1 Tax=Aquibacillus saliphilus TaxID=1909422 RepID=UPI001CEFF746|nr:spore germination protein GerPE [Aquibacillus saliphilus]
MNKRLSEVEKIKITSVAFSSIVEIGDANTSSPVNRVIAVQKEGGVYSDEGFDFDRFKIFAQEPAKSPGMPIIQKNTYHHNPTIHVKNVTITGVSASSLVQIGSLKHIDSEARLKHIRILEQEQNENDLIQ